MLLLVQIKASIKFVFVFFSRGRQLAEPQRPNAKFREDCWSEDEESPPPPIDYGIFL